MTMRNADTGWDRFRGTAFARLVPPVAARLTHSI